MSTNLKPLFLLILLSLVGQLSLEAKSTSQPDYKKEINSLSKQLEATKADLATLRKEVQALKNQKCTSSSECMGLIQEQQRRLTDSKELEHVLIKYGNNPEGMSALHYAIKQGDANAVNLLITNGAHPNTRDGNFSALARAASQNQYEIAQILLNSGADVNFTINSESYFPIYYAAQSGNGNLVNLLVKAGAKLDKINDTSSKKPTRYPITPLHVACAAGNFETIVALVENRARIDGYVNLQVKENSHLNVQEGGTPLDWAIWKLKCKNNPHSLDIIKFLVENGATRRVTELYGHGAGDYEYDHDIGNYLRSLGIHDY